MIVNTGLRRFTTRGSGSGANAASIEYDFANNPSLTGNRGGTLTLVRNTTATYVGSDGLIQTATANNPRFQYVPTTLVSQGLLVEPAATNIMLRSGDLSHAVWPAIGGVVAAPTVTGNIAVAPDGTTTAARIVYPQVVGAGAYSIVYQSLGALTAVARADSIYLKGNAGGEVVYLMETPGDGVTYTKTTCTLTTSWQRFQLLYTGRVANNFIQIGVDLRDATQTTKSAQTIFATFGQDELGSTATAYIPTTATSVTRNASVVSRTLGGEFNATAGTLYVDFIQPADTVSTQLVALALDDGTANNRIMIYVTSGTNIIIFSVSGVTKYLSSFPTQAAGTRIRIALAYTANDGIAYQNGVAASVSNAMTTIPTVTTFRVGNIIGLTQLSSTIAEATYYPRRLSDVATSGLTTI